jgi:hypothetical protein
MFFFGNFVFEALKKCNTVLENSIQEIQKVEKEKSKEEWKMIFQIIYDYDNTKITKEEHLNAKIQLYETKLMELKEKMKNGSVEYKMLTQGTVDTIAVLIDRLVLEKTSDESNMWAKNAEFYVKNLNTEEKETDNPLEKQFNSILCELDTKVKDGKIKKKFNVKNKNKNNFLNTKLKKKECKENKICKMEENKIEMENINPQVLDAIQNAEMKLSPELIHAINTGFEKYQPSELNERNLLHIVESNMEKLKEQERSTTCNSDISLSPEVINAINIGFRMTKKEDQPVGLNENNLLHTFEEYMELKQYQIHLSSTTGITMKEKGSSFNPEAKTLIEELFPEGPFVLETEIKERLTRWKEEIKEITKAESIEIGYQDMLKLMEAKCIYHQKIFLQTLIDNFKSTEQNIIKDFTVFMNSKTNKDVSIFFVLSQKTSPEYQYAAALFYDGARLKRAWIDADTNALQIGLKFDEKAQLAHKYYKKLADWFVQKGFWFWEELLNMNIIKFQKLQDNTLEKIDDESKQRIEKFKKPRKSQEEEGLIPYERMLIWIGMIYGEYVALQKLKFFDLEERFERKITFAKQLAEKIRQYTKLEGVDVKNEIAKISKLDSYGVQFENETQVFFKDLKKNFLIPSQREVTMKILDNYIETLTNHLKVKKEAIFPKKY